MRQTPASSCTSGEWTILKPAFLDAAGKADVGGAVQQDLVARAGERAEGGDHAAEHAVLVADVLRLEAGDAVARLVPADDGLEVLVARSK